MSEHVSGTGSSLVVFRAHLALYVFGFAYWIFCGLRTCVELSESLEPWNFDEGWAILGRRRKDVSIYSWDLFTNLVFRFLPWTVCHVVFTDVLQRHFQKNALCCFQVGFSLVALWVHLGPLECLFALGHSLLLYVVHFRGCKWLCWTVALAFYYFMINGPFPFLHYVTSSEDRYLLMTVVGWNMLRGLMFSLIQCDRKRQQRHHQASSGLCASVSPCLDYLCYLFYFPLLFTSPLVPFDHFERDFLQWPRQTVPWQRRFRLLLRVAFLFGIWALMEAFLHFVPLGALSFHDDLELLRPLPNTSLVGLTFAMIFFFMTMYVFIFGFAIAVSGLEGVATPPGPKCYGRINRYADVWRSFDVGMHNFIKRFILRPLVADHQRSVWRKSMAVAMCFGFVFLWHGTTGIVPVWVLINFMTISAERLIPMLVWHDAYAKLEKERPILMRHLVAIASMPVVHMIFIASSFFVCGEQFANLFVRRLYLEGSLVLIPLSIVYTSECYFCAQYNSEHKIA